MISLFVDDLKIPTISSYIVVRNYNEAVSYMRKEGCPDFISFDHDLGKGFSGLDIAKWMVERDMNDKGLFIPVDFSFKIHGLNPPGGNNIKGLLDNYLLTKKESKLNAAR